MSSNRIGDYYIKLNMKHEFHNTAAKCNYR